MIICKICTFPLDLERQLKFPHICLPFTCINCASPRRLFDTYCADCMIKVPCSLCTLPGKYVYFGSPICPMHLQRVTRNQSGPPQLSAFYSPHAGVKRGVNSTGVARFVHKKKTFKPNK